MHAAHIECEIFESKSKRYLISEIDMSCSDRRHDYKLNVGSRQGGSQQRDGDIFTTETLGMVTQQLKLRFIGESAMTPSAFEYVLKYFPHRQSVSWN